MPKTAVNVDELRAGPELDALVAERVMNWTAEGGGAFWNRGDKTVVMLPLFSTDIAAAWQVLNALKFNSKRVQRTTVPQPSEFAMDCWACMLEPHAWSPASPMSGDCVYAEADTAPLAICLAALKAVSA